MAKSKVTVTIDPDVLNRADRAAEAEGVSRSEFFEKALTEKSYRLLFEKAGQVPLPQSEQDTIRRILDYQQNPAASQ